MRRIAVLACFLVLLLTREARPQLVTGKVPVGKLGHELYYEVQGSGDPVVLIHGLTLDLREWDAQVAGLSDKHQVIRYDVVGHGRSSGLSASVPNGAVRDWDYLRDLLDHLGVDRAHIVGLSMGGEIAINFALQHPDRVQTLTPIDARLGGYNVASDLSDRFGSYISVSETQGVQAALSMWAADPLFAPANANPEVQNKLEQIVVQGHGALGEGAMFQWPNLLKVASLSPSAIRRLDEIEHPTLVMIGELDLVDFQLQANILDDDIRNSTKLVVPGAGHMSDMEQPEFVNRALLDFFAAHPIAALPGDFDADRRLTTVDIDYLSSAIRQHELSTANDLNQDGQLDLDDHTYWVRELRQTWFGDTDLDGKFDGGDLVTALAAGEYQDTIDGNSGWATGDWDGDGEFTSGDLVLALADGGYGQGPRAAAKAVPEPGSVAMVIMSVLGFLPARRCR